MVTARQSLGEPPPYRQCEVDGVHLTQAPLSTSRNPSPARQIRCRSRPFLEIPGSVTLGKIMHFPEFVKAPSLEIAVSAFVRDSENSQPRKSDL